MKRNPNAERVSALFRQRDFANNWSDLLSRDLQSLCRKAILAECRFPRSTLYQNQAVKDLLCDQEHILMKKGILRCQESSSDTSSISTALMSNLAESANGLSINLEKFRNRVNAIAKMIDELSQE